MADLPTSCVDGELMSPFCPRLAARSGHRELCAHRHFTAAAVSTYKGRRNSVPSVSPGAASPTLITASVPQAQSSMMEESNSPRNNASFTGEVAARGLEPRRLSAQDPKPSTSGCRVVNFFGGSSCERTDPRGGLNSNRGFVELGSYALNRLRRKPTIEFYPWNAPPASTNDPGKPGRDPLRLARYYQSPLDTGKFESRAALARFLGVSRARVTQVLNRLEDGKATGDDSNRTRSQLRAPEVG
jgi:hypothetical protein